MLLKTHFIASNSGSHKELVIHAQNGFVSQKNSSKEYIKLIANILDNINNYKNVLNNAFKFAKLNFNDKKYIREIKKHYDDLS